MNVRQAQTLSGIAKRLRKLAETGLDALNDDSMEGDVWSALNRILSDADYLAQSSGEVA